MGNVDMGIIRLKVDGVDIDEFKGFTSIRTGGEKSYNEGPGEEVFGFLFKSRANKFGATFLVGQSSDHLKLLLGIAGSVPGTPAREVTILAYVPDEDQGIIGTNELTSMSCRAVLNHTDGAFKDSQPGNFTFQILGRNPVFGTKAGA